MLNRPKRSVKFALEQNQTKVFNSTDTVHQNEPLSKAGSDDRSDVTSKELTKSAERNEPCTPSILVKFSANDSEEEKVKVK